MAGLVLFDRLDGDQTGQPTWVILFTSAEVSRPRMSSTNRDGRVSSSNLNNVAPHWPTGLACRSALVLNTVEVEQSLAPH